MDIKKRTIIIENVLFFVDVVLQNLRRASNSSKYSLVTRCLPQNIPYFCHTELIITYPFQIFSFLGNTRTSFAIARSIGIVIIWCCAMLNQDIQALNEKLTIITTIISESRSVYLYLLIFSRIIDRTFSVLV